jgi:hypothetical protein
MGGMVWEGKSKYKTVGMLLVTKLYLIEYSFCSSNWVSNQQFVVKIDIS